MVTCRPDISYPCIKLSQFSIAPSQVHYNAVEHIFKYLAGTPDQGVHYWRSNPIFDLPHEPHPTMLLQSDVTAHQPDIPTQHVYGYVDLDWAADSNHCRSISGMVFLFAGGAIAWRSQVQKLVSTSSTEAEFIAASDLGKLALYICSILDDLSILQLHATLIFEDNCGAYLMAHATTRLGLM